MSVEAVIQAWSSRPFSYGPLDCCQFAGAVVEAKTGTNPMAAFMYGDEQQAHKIIDAYGGLENAITATLGEPIAVCDAIDGDVLLVETDSGPAAAICYQERAIIRPLRGGITDWPLKWASKAWRT